MLKLFERMSRPIIRRIGPEASHECSAVHAQCFTKRWSPTEFEHLLIDRQVCADAAVSARTRRMMGFVLSRIAADEAEILTIGVAPAARGKGIAGVLLSTHLGRLTAAGTRRVFLEVDHENEAALALYASFGFQKVGERKAYYRRAAGDTAKALVMRRDLG